MLVAGAQVGFCRLCCGTSSAHGLLERSGWQLDARRTLFCGRPRIFAIVGIWVITDPIFEFSDTSQLVIKTGTIIVTFLMGFLIQNTQNRDAAGIQIR